MLKSISWPVSKLSHEEGACYLEIFQILLKDFLDMWRLKQRDEDDKFRGTQNRFDDFMLKLASSSGHTDWSLGTRTNS